MKKINKLAQVLAICLIFLLCGCSEPQQKAAVNTPAYTVTISNFWAGSKSVDCDHFVIKGNTYLLYDSNDKLISTMTATDGYVIRANGN